MNRLTKEQKEKLADAKLDFQQSKGSELEEVRKQKQKEADDMKHGLIAKVILDIALLFMMNEKYRWKFC